MPVLKALAQGPMLALSGAFSLFAGGIELAVRGWRMLFEVLGDVTTSIYDSLKPGFDVIWGWMERFSRAVGETVRQEDQLGDNFKRVGRGLYGPYSSEDWYGEKNRQIGSEVGGDWYGQSAAHAGRSMARDTPEARIAITNDFRGSQITVKQDFREADPDRVLVQMFDAIHRAADYRTGSGYSPVG